MSGHQSIRATLWAPLDQLTVADVEEMLRVARMLGAKDSSPVWVEGADDAVEDDDDTPGRLLVGTVLEWRAGDL